MDKGILFNNGCQFQISNLYLKKMLLNTIYFSTIRYRVVQPSLESVSMKLLLTIHLVNNPINRIN